jgi:hypothetical protein
MSFFDKKEDVLEISLTPHGRHLLSKGQLLPVYYSFIDDDVLYDVTAASGSESNYQVKNRILQDTPTLKPQTNFTGLDNKVKDLKNDLVSDATKYNLYTIGTSNNIEDFAPSWELTLIRNEISASSTTLSSSNGIHNIPQIDLDIEYTMSVDNINLNPNPRGLAPSPELQVGRIFQDGTYLKVEPDQAIFRILEKNGFLHGESMQIDAYKYDITNEQKLIPLSFIKRMDQVVNDILIEEQQKEIEELDPNNVEYFFDIRVDKEIPLSDICEGIKELKSKGIFGDFEIECPDVGSNVRTNIYSSPITPEDIEDCDT